MSEHGFGALAILRDPIGTAPLGVDLPLAGAVPDTGANSRGEALVRRNFSTAAAPPLEKAEAEELDRLLESA